MYCYSLMLLIMFSQIVRCNGKALLPYKGELVTVLNATLHLKCKDAADLSGILLRHLLKALTLTYALDYRSTHLDWDAPLSENLPIRVCTQLSSFSFLVHHLTCMPYMVIYARYVYINFILVLHVLYLIFIYPTF